MIKGALGLQYQPLNRVEILSRSLNYNYSILSDIGGMIKIAPVLKSNAYGHGLVETARILDSVGAPFFCVDSIYEAYKLHKAGIETKILVMGYINPDNLRFKKLPFSFAVYDLGHFKRLYERQPQAGIHLFVDTGMGREGIPVGELDKFLSGIPTKAVNNIEGVMSHFAASDKTKDKRTLTQVTNFKRALKILNDSNIHPKWIHMANSSGLLNNRKLGLNAITNMARCGIAIYGIDPEGKNKRLKPAAKLLTRVAQVKTIVKGSSVGYDFTYTAEKDIKTAVLAIGYNDGVDRELSNKGTVVIKGKPCPIIGRVSMNITTVDVSSLKSIKVGDEVEIKFVIPSINKIPYEFLVNLNPEIKRVVV